MVCRRYYSNRLRSEIDSMSLLFCDSFDHYMDFAQKWDTGKIIDSASFRIDSVGRAPKGGSSNGLRFGRGLQYIGLHLPNVTTFIIGFAIKPTAGRSVSPALIHTYDSNAEQIRVRLNTSNQLVVYRSTTLLDTSTEALTVGEWSYLEMKFTIGNTGSFEIRINGSAIMSGSPIDTQNTGNSYIDKLLLGDKLVGQFTSYPIFIDDFYLCDDAGSVNNDFLLNLGSTIYVESRSPDSYGTYEEWTRIGAGSNNFEVIDEVEPENTEYIKTTVAALDTYSLPDLNTPSGNVKAIAFNIHERKQDAGLARHRGVLYDPNTGEFIQSSLNSVGAGYRYKRQFSGATHCTIIEVDSDNNQMNISKVNAFEAGVRRQ